MQEVPAGLQRLTEAPLPCFELAAMDGTDDLPDAQAAAAYCASVDTWKARLEAARQAASIDRGRLSARVADALYPAHMRLSATSVDRYGSCRFSYFLRYALKATPRRPAGFDAPEVGTYIHYLMEHIARAARDKGGFGQLTADVYKRQIIRH